LKFSGRISSNLQVNAVSRLTAEKRAAGATLLDLTESNPTHAGIHYPSGFLNALANPLGAVYEPESFGLPSAREAIAEAEGVDVERVVLASSTSEAYSWLFKLLCDPGCEVLVPRPSYPLFDYLARLECVEVRHYPLFYDQGWYIDFHALKQSINQRTRAIVLVNPNNPTGHYVKRHELAELLELAVHHGLAIISDEVFAGYPISPAADSIPTLKGVADPCVFTLHGLSKAVGLPQMKLAWMLCNCPQEAMARLEIIADTYLSAGTPVQLALPSLLALRPSVEQQIRERVRTNLAILPRHLVVEAGWYAVVPVHDEDAVVETLLRDHDVLVQPGYFYDFERSGYVIVSLLTPPDIFRRGVAALQTVTSLQFGANS
jgi:hypothetical protein